MSRIRITNIGDYFDLPNPGLRAYFGRVKEGQPLVYDTPFAKGESTTAMLKAWEAELVSISDKWPTLYTFEQDMRAKVGPMSVQKPLKDRFTDIRSYYEAIHLASEPLQERALKAVLAEFTPIRGLRVRGQVRTVNQMKKSTNSGAPYFKKRRDVVNETVPVKLDYRVRSTETYQWIQDEIWTNTAVLGWRGQEGGPKPEDVKQRVVWMFPFGVNICELQVYQPLIEGAQRHGLVPAWVSMDLVDKRITDLFDTKSRDDLVVCTDFSKYDQHFNESMQRAAEFILSALLAGGSYSSDWIYSVFPVKYEIPMMDQLGYIWTGKHGMASGSGGTNVDETLVHRALQYEAAIRSNSRLNPNSQCLGDDGILSYPGITVEDVVKAYSSHGQEMNLTKQYASTQDCVYLRRWHHNNYRMEGRCVGVYSTFRALGRLRYLERYQNPEYWNERMVALRQLSILENVKYHPLRDQFAQFCMKRDKYRLGLDIPGFLDNLERESQKAIDHMPDFLGYTKTLQAESQGLGINDWWIVKYLKSLA